MREIKFRFWDSKEKRMYEMTPELVICYNGEVSRLLYHEDEHNAEYSCIEWEGTVYSEHIIPLQYTGLKDINGKEIYEGDIVKIPNCKNPITPFTLCEVRYENGAYKIISLKNKKIKDYLANWECLIIGNIYENPELINAE